MAATAPAFQFYAADYLSDEKVLLMSLEEEGAYIRLLSICWREGSIPADHALLSRLCKGASTNVLSVVEKCFQPHSALGGRLVHGRLEEERAKQAEWREKSSQGGRRSAQSRAAKRAPTLKAGPAARLEPPLNHPSNGGAKGGGTLQSSSSSGTVPPNPRKRGKREEAKGAKPTTPEALALHQLFRRRLGTEWNAREVAKFKEVRPTMEEVEQVAAYMAAEKAKGEEGRHRRDLGTLLNNWAGEVDRARLWAEGGGQPAQRVDPADGLVAFAAWAREHHPERVIDISGGWDPLPTAMKREFREWRKTQ